MLCGCACGSRGDRNYQEIGEWLSQVCTERGGLDPTMLGPNIRECMQGQISDADRNNVFYIYGRYCMLGGPQRA